MEVQQEVKGMGENTYDPHAATYSNISMMELNVYLETPTFMNIIGDLKDKSILDCGCGEGQYTRMFRKMTTGQVYGLDISPGMIEKAKEQTPTDGQEITYLVQDVSAPFKLPV